MTRPFTDLQSARALPDTARSNANVAKVPNKRNEIFTIVPPVFLFWF
jgi:hypothetical protein